MSQFNFLSGSSIDNYTEFLFDAFKSEQMYLGFSRGTPDNQWGVNTLVYVEYPHATFLNSIAKVGDSTASNKFFDLNSLDYVAGAANFNSKRKIYIKKFANSDITFSNPLTIDPALNLSNLSLSYMGENWILIKGLPSNYFSYMTPSTSAAYYITNYNNDMQNMRIKIINKHNVNVPFFSTNCKLFMNLPVSAGGTGLPVLVKENLQRTANILGENFVSGMRDNGIIIPSDPDAVFAEDTQANKEKLKHAVFTLVDYSSPTNVLYGNMTFVDPNPGDTTQIYEEVSGYGNSKKYVTFKYTYTANEYQYVQFIIGSNQIDELGIWCEALPYTTVHPVADANPPALDISYLKNTNLSSSLFDINGLTKISASGGDVEFVKEIFSSAASAEYASYGFTIEKIDMVGENINHLGFVRTAIPYNQTSDTIQMQDFHTFVVGDVVQIPLYPDLYLTDQSTPVSAYTVVDIDNTPASAYIKLNTAVVLATNQTLPINYQLKSNATNVTASMMLAKTTNKQLALKYGLYNVLISKTVPLLNINGSPTENIYRQLIVSYRPKDSNDVLCSANVYNGDTTFGNANFNPNTWTYNNGTIFYIGNKIPIYRKWASTDEQFKIII